LGVFLIKLFFFCSETKNSSKKDEEQFFLGNELKLEPLSLKKDQAFFFKNFLKPNIDCKSGYSHNL
jgi:hypothetical protein